MYTEEPIFNVPNSQKGDHQPDKKWYKHWWGQLLIGFLVLFSVFSVAFGIYVAKVIYLLRSGEITASELFGGSAAEPDDQIVLTNLATDDDPSVGPKDAKVVVVEFSDFQCPYCAQVYPVVKELIKDYSDRVLFVFRDFPLTDIHPQAVLASLAGECANEQGKFWEMHDKIFENQDKINEDNLAAWSVQIGLNSLQFSSCMGAGKYLPEIEADLQEGLAFGVEATPTFFINGKPLRGAVSLATFESIILAELSR
ncbi:MAG: DsbA family protein [Candidatus Buchananbacteria bacterium]|nr:DsbA family protein [Candidatus Buchananbacteria bacterium]